MEMFHSQCFICGNETGWCLKWLNKKFVPSLIITIIIIMWHNHITLNLNYLHRKCTGFYLRVN